MIKKLFILLLCLTFNFSAFAQEKSDNKPQVRASLVQTVQVSNIEVGETRRLIGQLIALETGEVAAKIAGPIEKVFVIIGDKVKKDDLLAKIDQSGYFLTQETRLSEVKLAEAEIVTANRSLERLEAEANRIERLRASSAFSPARLETATLDANVQRAIILEKESKLAIAKANLERANLDLKWSEIKAPFDGIILSSTLNSGAFVTSGKTSFTIMNESDLEVAAEIPANLINYIMPNQEVDVEVNNSNMIKAQLRAILPEENQRTATRNARFSVISPIENLGLASGQTVNLSFQIYPKKMNDGESNDSNQSSNIGIPKDALIIQNGENVVFVVKEGKAMRQVVEIGKAIGDHIIIINGLALGDEVVLRGNERLVDGAPIRTK